MVGFFPSLLYTLPVWHLSAYHVSKFSVVCCCILHQGGVGRGGSDREGCEGAWGVGGRLEEEGCQDREEGSGGKGGFGKGKGVGKERRGLGEGLDSIMSNSYAALAPS